MLIPETKAAEMLSMSIAWMQRARLTGEGPPYVKIKHAVRYRTEDLEKWINDRIQSSTSENGGKNA